MQDYFDKFRNMKNDKSHEAELKAGVPLSERARFDKGDLFIDDKLVFTVPIKNDTMYEIKLIGVLEGANPARGRIYVGTGSCCHGHLYVLGVGADYVQLSDIFAADTNVCDILPVDSGRAAVGGVEDILITGIGCTGRGIRMFNVCKQRMIDIISNEEYSGLMMNMSGVYPRFAVDVDKGEIFLELHEFNSGRYRDHVNLRERLEAQGVDIEKTIRLYEDYHKTERPR
jgi:hypothetical protein